MDKRLFFAVMIVSAFLTVYGSVLYSKYQKDKVLRVWKSSNSKIENSLGDEVAKSGVVSGEDSKKDLNRPAKTVVVYNGTSKIGLSGKFVSALTEKTKIEVVDRQNASKRDYPRSFVVDINNHSSSAAKEIANFLDCPVTTIMPDGEATPAADVLVVLGGDYR